MNRFAPAAGLFTRAGSVRVLFVGALMAACTAGHGAGRYHLALGTFEQPDNALRWAGAMQQVLGTPTLVAAHGSNPAAHRVLTHALDANQFAQIAERARQHDLAYWRVAQSATRARGTGVANPTLPVAAVASVSVGPEPGRASAVEDAVDDAPPPSRTVALGASRGGGAVSPSGEQSIDVDLGLQTRAYRQDGLWGQDRFQPSASMQAQWRRGWDGGRQQVVVTPFLRLDGDDDERTHFDLREGYWNRVGDAWEINLGVKQEFWGVTEFHHLVDIINQTDLVENIDGEDKLGQPMAQLSLVRDWGIVDVFVLTGFRERTFPGHDGRLRAAIHIDDDLATFDSGAEEARIDAALRWSYQTSILDVGVYHFSGTSREPEFSAGLDAAGVPYLAPHYPVIDQTGMDLQMVLDDWALKLEAISRHGFGDAYFAANVGVERTFVGTLGTRSDIGLVVEYMFDERGDDAVNTLFENDLALGARWFMNDTQDTQALFGVIWDVESEEYIVSVEGSRRLGESWQLSFEGRVFGGGREPEDPLEDLFDPSNKTGFLQRDDLLQLEVTRFF